jgi:hypothetical protein
MSLSVVFERLLRSLVKVERSFFRKVTVRPEDESTTLRVLEQLQKSGEWRAIPYMVWLLTVESARIRQGAADTLSAIVASNADALPQLDLEMRKQTAPRWVGDVLAPPMTLSSQDVLRIAAWCEDGRVLGVFTMVPDGRAREAATHLLGSTKPNDAIPFLLIRLNDWVAPVATAARRAIEPLLTENQARLLASQLPLIERLGTQARVDNSDLRSRIYALLAGTPSGREAIFDGLAAAPHQRIRRLCASVVARMDPLSQEQLTSLLDDADPMIRLSAARRLVEVSLTPALLQRVASDRSAQLRALALDLAIERRSPELATLLETFVLDTNFWIRDRARRALRATGQPVLIYRAAVVAKRGDPLLGAISGLGECGDASDVDTLRPFLSQGASRQRQAALRSIIKLDRSNVGPILRDALGSDCVAVSKLAAHLITTRSLVIAKDDVLELSRDPRPHVAASAARILRSLSTWHALAWALENTGSPEGSIQRTRRTILTDWSYPRADLYSRPSADLRDQLLVLLRNVPEAWAPAARRIIALLH